MSQIFSLRRLPSLSIRKTKTPRKESFIDPRIKKSLHVPAASLDITPKQLLRYLAASVILPQHQIVWPFLVLGAVNQECCYICPEMVSSVENYERKIMAGESIDSSEIPLIFVTVNNTGHASLIFLSGITENYPQRQLFSVGLIQGAGDPGNTDIASMAKHVPVAKDLYNKVILDSPDVSNDIFGKTAAGKEYEFEIKEIQVVTSDILRKFEKIVQDMREYDIEVTKKKVEEVLIYTGETYAYVSFQGAPNLTGINCASFISNLLPQMSAGIPAQPKKLHNYCRPLSPEDMANVVFGLINGTTYDGYPLTTVDILEIISLNKCGASFMPRFGGKRRFTKKRKAKRTRKAKRKAKRTSKAKRTRKH
jgi:hypothetical protein